MITYYSPGTLLVCVSPHYFFTLVFVVFNFNTYGVFQAFQDITKALLSKACVFLFIDRGILQHKRYTGQRIASLLVFNNFYVVLLLMFRRKNKTKIISLISTSWHITDCAWESVNHLKATGLVMSTEQYIICVYQAIGT